MMKNIFAAILLMVLLRCSETKKEADKIYSPGFKTIHTSTCQEFINQIQIHQTTYISAHSTLTFGIRQIQLKRTALFYSAAY
jgi:hypothetical protein